MLKINGLENNIIDLSGEIEYINEFDVLSLNEYGKRLPFQIDLVTSSNIWVSLFKVSSIKVEIDVNSIVKDEYITLKNINGEKLVITIKPNTYVTEEDVFKFKMTKATFKDNGELKLKILSKVNNEEIGWKCIFDGQPISYEITPRNDVGSAYVTVKLLSEIFSNYTSELIFEQNFSGNKIVYKILNTPEGMRKAY